jgi:hypothetical protein
VFHLTYTLLIPAGLLPLLGQLTIATGDFIHGDIEVKVGLILYFAVLLIEMIIAALTVRYEAGLDYHQEDSLIHIVVPSLPPLVIRILYSILLDFDLLPHTGLDSVIIHFVMVVLMDLMVSSFYLAIVLADRPSSQVVGEGSAPQTNDGKF